ncbi:MAG: Asp-tRNA(Asn)/Glu-tRNA(Gln) amidotransferase subunit GatB [Bacteriovoracales bacterium]|nr:Asp-tRNA(Asn)/Glu-tRNA(Gln) amidotransferase subunit GatB [Bacteriovoracales bacterium]
MESRYNTIIGLEVHAQLATKTKTWCRCQVVSHAIENTKVCEICSGHPGTLPSMNQKVRDFAILLGLATQCRINLLSFFDRKNYFYPDLPKGYQITQYDVPICQDGHIEITSDNGEIKKIGIERIQIEEDTGKSIHNKKSTLIDLNRAGTPLLEIVGKPDIVNSKEAVSYLKKLHALLTYLGISSGNMQEGNMRCDVNISLSPKRSQKRGTRTETKNLNSFRSVEHLIELEVQRQGQILDEGKKVIQQTLSFDVNSSTIKILRTKSDANDYRYFPEPDLSPLAFEQSLVDKLAAQLPELPDAKKSRFQGQYKLSSYDADFLTSSKFLADYFEKAVKFFRGKDAKKISNWIMVELFHALNEVALPIEKSPISPADLSELLNMIDSGEISGKMAKEIFQKMFDEHKKARTVIEELDLRQINSDDKIEELIDTVLEQNLNEVTRYENGEKRLFGFFVGQVMKLSKGQANPAKVNKLLHKKLD